MEKEVGTFKYFDITASKYPTEIIKSLYTTSDSLLSIIPLKKSRSEGMMLGEKEWVTGLIVFLLEKLCIKKSSITKDGKLEGNL